MSILKNAADAIVEAGKSVLHHDGVKPTVSGAAQKARDGIDVLEAASLNRDHRHIPSSRPEHLKTIFGLAAACVALGVAIPVLGTGLAVSISSIALMEAGKLLGYRGLRVLMPFDPERMARPAEGGGLKNMVHNTLDFFEAVSLNRDHPWMKASGKSGFGKNFGLAALGVGLGMGLTGGTVGLPAFAGVGITEAGKFAAYRAYRILIPYQDDLAPQPST